MDDLRFGLAIRALRRRLGWRQRDLAIRAHVRQQDISDVERGRLERLRVSSVRRISAAVDARTSLELLWRGGMLDRLVDARHADMVERTAAVLAASGWQVRAEVSFAINGDRGSIDLLAWHEATRSALIIEVKTELTSVEETLRRFDTKQRHGPAIAAEVLGWRPTVMGSLLILPDASTARRRVADHARTFAGRFPDAGRDVRRWLRHPDRPFAAVWFLSMTPTVGDKRAARTAHRVRLPRTPPSSTRPR